MSEYLLEWDQCGQSFQEALEKLAECAETQTTLAQEFRRGLDDIRAISNAHSARTNLSRRRVPYSGIIKSRNLKNIRRQAYKNSEEVDIKKWKGKWTKVMV